MSLKAIASLISHLMVGHSYFTKGVTQQIRRYWYNIVPITFQIYLVYGQKTCIYTIFNKPELISTAGQNTGLIFLAPSRRLVRTEPESFLKVDQIRLLTEVRDTASGPTQLFLPDGATDPIRILTFHGCGQSTCNHYCTKSILSA